jgi:hypothetical protein
LSIAIDWIASFAKQRILRIAQRSVERALWR